MTVRSFPLAVTWQQLSPIRPAVRNYGIARADDVVFQLTVYSDAGATVAMDVTGVVAVLSVVDSYGTTMVSAVGTIITASAGRIDIPLTAAQTAELGGRFLHRITLSVGGGADEVVNGALTVSGTAAVSEALRNGDHTLLGALSVDDNATIGRLGGTRDGVLLGNVSGGKAGMAVLSASDNADLRLVPKGTGVVLADGNALVGRAGDTRDGVLVGHVTGGVAGLEAVSSSTNADLWLRGKGSGKVAVPGILWSDGNATFGTAGSTQNGLVVGNLFAGAAAIQVTGPGTDIDLSVASKGIGAVVVRDGASILAQVSRGGVTSPANRLVLTPSAAGYPIEIRTAGTDTDRSVRVVPSGAGVFMTDSAHLGGGTTTFSGSSQAANQYAMRSAANLAGGTTGRVDWNHVVIPSDTVAAGDIDAGSQVSWLTVEGNLQDGFSGARAGIDVRMSVPGQVSSGSTQKSRQWAGIMSTFASSRNQGGTSTASGATSAIGYAGGDQAWLQSGATNWTGIVGREIDVGIWTGASAGWRVGLQIVGMGQVQGATIDAGLRLSSQLWNADHVGFRHGVMFQPGAIEPTAGTLVGYSPGPPGALAAPGYHYKNPVAALGFDLLAYRFTEAAQRFAGGWRVNPDGSLAVAGVKLSTSDSAASLDAVGYRCTGVTSFATGQSFESGDQIYDDHGNIITIGDVNTSGVPQTWTLTVQGGTTGAAPSNPVQFYGGRGAASGTGTATVNLAWTRVSQLQLNASGGNTVIGTGSALATGATSGFLMIPTCAGIPTGTVGGAGKAALVCDSTNHKLYVNDGSGWVALN